jgi:hypothetical protein
MTARATIRPRGCNHQVYDGNYGFRSCTRQGLVVSADGRFYCKQHDPIVVKRRDAENQAKRDERYERETNQMKLDIAYRALGRVVYEKGFASDEAKPLIEKIADLRRALAVTP